MSLLLLPLLLCIVLLLLPIPASPGIRTSPQQEIYRAGEAEILRIGAERDAATRRARERCEAFRDEAERRCRELGTLEREALARLRQAQAQEEAERASRVSEAERRLEEARRSLVVAVETAQVSVAERVKALAGESSATRASLLDTRERLDGHVRAEIDRRRGDTDLVDIRLDSILCGQQAELGGVLSSRAGPKRCFA